MFNWLKKLKRLFFKKHEITNDKLIAGDVAIVDTVEDNNNIILKNSINKLNVLKIFKQYFDNKLIDDIINQTQVINNVFKSNENLTFKKLEQFNYYYTDHLIELLDKLKNKINQNIVSIKTNLEIINNKINTYNEHYKFIDISKFKSKYSVDMSIQLSCLYNSILNKNNDFRFKKIYDLVTFGNRTYNYMIDDKLYTEFEYFDKTNQYEWESYYIDRTLMGKLKKYLFLIDYECSIMYLDNVIEIFKLIETDEYFMYNTKTFTFNFINYNKIKSLCVHENTEQYKLIAEVDKLKYDKNILELKLKSIINDNITIDVIDVLKKYLQKIEDVELYENITTINIETENLQTMLELEKLVI